MAGGGLEAMAGAGLGPAQCQIFRADAAGRPVDVNLRLSCSFPGSDDMFDCDCCGLCCQNIRNSEIYAHLDRGDGVCRYYDDDTRLCSIYENRPDLCRVDLCYEKYFKGSMTLEQYYAMNHEACNMLKVQAELTAKSSDTDKDSGQGQDV